MTFEPNQQGIDELHAEIARKVEAVDREIRAEWTGKPADEIESHAIAAFAAIGIDFSDLREYAEAVAQDKPFDFVLR